MDHAFCIVCKKLFKNLIFYHINAAYALEVRNLLESQLSSDIEFYAESFEMTDKDFKPQLTKLKANKIEALVIDGLGLKYVTLLNQIKELKIGADLLGDMDFALGFAKKNAQKTQAGLKIYDGVRFAMIDINIDSLKTYVQNVGIFSIYISIKPVNLLVLLVHPVL